MQINTDEVGALAEILADSVSALVENRIGTAGFDRSFKVKILGVNRKFLSCIKAGDTKISEGLEPSEMDELIQKYSIPESVGADEPDFYTFALNGSYIVLRSEKKLSIGDEAVIRVPSGSFGDMYIENDNGKASSSHALFVQPEEPDEAFCSPEDRWVKIYDSSNKHALAFYIYEKQETDNEEEEYSWTLRYIFGTGENIGRHNERSNDYSGNTIADDGDYDTLIGKSNTGSGYYNFFSGRSNNFLKLGSCNITGGQQNSCSSSYGPNYSILHGFGNSYNSQITASVCTGQNSGYSANVNNSAIIGAGQYIDRTVYNCFVGGNCGRPASSSYINIGGGAYDVPKNIFYVTSSGNVYAAGSYNTIGSDFAEFYEWLDGNPENEDRRGLLVSLDGEMIVPANGKDILGAVSAAPTIVGNCDGDEWHGKYRRDVFGCLIKDSGGNNVLSEDFDGSAEFTPRSQRKEWAAVGLIGRLIVRDNGKCTVNGYCAAENGIAVPSTQKTNVRVLKRIDNKHIKIQIVQNI